MAFEVPRPEKQLVSQRHVLHRISVRRRRGLQQALINRSKLDPARSQPCQWDGQNPRPSLPLCTDDAGCAVDRSRFALEGRAHQESKRNKYHSNQDMPVRANQVLVMMVSCCFGGSRE